MYSKSSLGIVIVIALCGYMLPEAFNYWSWMKYNRIAFSHSPGKCQQIQPIENGSEDIDILPNGLAFISTGLQWPAVTLENKNGIIMAYDFNKDSTTAVEIPIVWSKGHRSKPFNPHGISVWINKEKVILFVVSHYTDGEAVDRFLFDKQKFKLYHQETIRDDAFVLLNDVAATGESSFYFTNYAHFKGSLPMTLERLLGLNWGWVGYYDGAKVTRVVAGLSMPNGISVSPTNRNHVYVAVAGHDEIHLYERDGDKMTLIQTVNLMTTVDNMYIDPITEDIWAGCHPVRWRLVKRVHSKLKNFNAPSQVLRIHTNKGFIDSSTIEEVFMDTGDLISGSSVAAYYNGKILIGSVQDKAVLCEISKDK